MGISILENYGWLEDVNDQDSLIKIVDERSDLAARVVDIEEDFVEYKKLCKEYEIDTPPRNGIYDDYERDFCYESGELDSDEIAREYRLHNCVNNFAEYVPPEFIAEEK